MIIEDKNRKKALRTGCLVLVAGVVILLLAAYGLLQLVYNHLILPNL